MRPFLAPKIEISFCRLWLIELLKKHKMSPFGFRARKWLRLVWPFQSCFTLWRVLFVKLSIYCLISNLGGLVTNSFIMERPTKSERGNWDLQNPQPWCLSGLVYWTRYSHLNSPNFTEKYIDARTVCLAIHSPRVATPSRLTKGKLGEGVPFFGHVETQTMQTADGADYADCADCADWVLFLYLFRNFLVKFYYSSLLPLNMCTDVYLQGSWVGNEKVTGPCLPADVKAVSRVLLAAPLSRRSEHDGGR